MLESRRFFVRGSFDGDEFDSNHLVTEPIKVNLGFSGDNIVHNNQKYGWWKKSFTPLFTRFYTSQVVQDVFHQQYV